MSHNGKRKKAKYAPPSNRWAKRGISYNGPSTRTGHHRQNRGTAILTFLGIGIAMIAVVGLVLMIIAVQGSRVASASGGGPPGPTPPGRHVCGTTGEPACPPDDLGWVAITSESPGAVSAAIAKSEHFTMMQSHYNYASLDIPALVHSFGPHTGSQYYDDDHWVVSVRDASSREVGVFDFVYDRANHRLRFSSFGALGEMNPNAHQAFPSLSADMAVAQLKSQRKLGVQPGKQPELIFFPINPRWRDLTSPVHNWRGGGEAPTDPMWHIVGSDGHDYFVGVDLHTYVLANLPFAPGGQP